MAHNDEADAASRAGGGNLRDGKKGTDATSPLLGKRPRPVALPGQKDDDDDEDPYAFPNDEQIKTTGTLKLKPVSPLSTFSRLPATVKPLERSSPPTNKTTATTATTTTAAAAATTTTAMTTVAVMKATMTTTEATVPSRCTSSTDTLLRASPATTDADAAPKTAETARQAAHTESSKRKAIKPDEPIKMDAPAKPAKPADTVDVIMGGTDESAEQPSIGEKKPPPTPTVDTDPRPPSPPPLPDIKLREPHKLRRLREAREKAQDEAEHRAHPRTTTSEEERAREGLRRALALALDHVGFSSANNDALESFLLMTETYVHALATDVARFALGGRRSQPIPLDFDTSLARFNIGTGALRPHLRNPIRKKRRAAVAAAAAAAAAAPSSPPHNAASPYDYGRDLPLLSSELSGRCEKEAKAYIPSGFPDFPSIHTYRYTPVDVDTVTVHGSGLRYDDGTMLVLPSEEPSAEDREPGPGLGSTPGPAGVAGTTSLLENIPLRSADPKRIREAAAMEAKQAEEALRGLMRASKVNKLKEVRAAADRNTLNKQRYALWETAMRELIVEQKGGPPDQKDGGGALSTIATVGLAAALREEIADQSMMVNAEKVFHRREIPRKARKIA